MPSVFLIRGSGDVFLCCDVCKRPLRLASSWLAFRPDQQLTEGRWVHKDCLDGTVETLFGQRRVTLLRGTEALQKVAASLAEA
jgi:hypothetical protein